MLKASKELMAQERRRIVTESFAGTGVVGRPGEVWRIVAGVPMPQALEQNSLPHDGPVPYDAIVHDEAAHAVYTKLNTPRPEPPPPVLLTAEGVCQHLRLSEAQFRSARETGFPKPTETSRRLRRRRYSHGTDPPVASGSRERWMERVKALGVGR